MASLVPNPSEVSLLQTYSVNKLLENFSYDLIFPMDLPNDNGSSTGRSDSDKMPSRCGKLAPIRTSYGFDEMNQQFEDNSTPSSVQSDYFSFASKNQQGCNGGSNSSQQWYSSRPNISQMDNNFPENNLLFSPPKRYLSDSNLSHYHGTTSGETSPMENPSFNGNHNNSIASPFKGDFNNKGGLDRHSGLLPEYEPYHTRSSFNLNNYGNTSPAPVQKADKATMYSSDLLNLLALNSSNNSDSYASIKGLEHTMRLLQQQQQQQLQLTPDHRYNNHQNHSYHHHHQNQNHQQRSPSFGSSSYSRQNSGSSEDNSVDFRQISMSSLGGGSSGGGGRLNKFSHTNSSNFSSCSSIDMNSGTAAVRTWNGIIPTRTSKAVTYSQKVFLGGIPWETSEETLKHIFGRYGPLRVEWPGKDPNFSTKPKGCVYIIFENEKQVRDLLGSCQLVGGRSASVDDGKYFYKFPWKNLKTKNVEVIPWNIADSNYVSSSQILDPSKTIFVGALHGKLTAEGLALIMNDLFDGVVYAGIDTDKHKYPLGAGRVTFNNPQSYMKAIQTGYLLIKTPVFTKKVQIDPYLEDNLCSSCNIHHGPYYCRDLACFRYFCRVCWQLQHTSDSLRAHHRPLTRNSKSQSIVFND